MTTDLSDRFLSVTMRAMPVFFAFVTFRAVMIGYRDDRWIPATTAVVLMGVLILISNKARLTRMLHRTVPMWGVGPFRFLFALVFFTAMLVLRFAVPPSFSAAVLAVFVPAFVLCYLAPGFVFREVAGLGPRILPHLRNVPVTQLDPVVYWWVNPASCFVIALFAIGTYGFVSGSFLPSGQWKSVSAGLAVLLGAPSTIFMIWLIWKLREGQMISIRPFIPSFISLTVAGGAIITAASYFAVLNAVPQMWHLITSPETTTQTYIVRTATDHSGLRACRRNMTVSPEVQPDLRLSICGGKALRIASDIRPGDVLGVEGRTSWLGQSIDLSLILPKSPSR